MRYQRHPRRYQHVRVPLSDLKLRNLKPADKPYKLADGGGLHILVTPAGGRLWRLAYRHGGKQKGLALGKYPELGLAEARELRDKAKEALAEGKDPAVVQKTDEPVPDRTFKEVAEEWYAKKEPGWTTDYSSRVKGRIETHIYPAIGADSIATLKPRDVLAAVQPVEERGTIDTAHRLLQYIGSVCRYAIVSGYREDGDPTYRLAEALTAKPETQGMLALPVKELPRFMQALDEYEGEVTTRAALHLTILTALRTKESRFGRWEELEDLEGRTPLWRVPASRMKMKREHLVPLVPQAVQVLRELHRHTGKSSYMFPSDTKRGVISENAMLYAVYRMGYHSRATVHGFRTVFSTVLNESLKFSPDAIEMQIAHKPAGVRGVYNAAQYLKERWRMMRWWADFLDQERRKKS